VAGWALLLLGFAWLTASLPGAANR